MNNIESLIIAIKNRKTSDIRKFINEGGNINEKFTGCTPLIFAAMFGDKKTVDFLLKNGADVSIKSDNGLDVIRVSVIEQNFGAIKALKEFGVDFNMFIKEGISPLSVAFLNGDTKMFKELLRCGANPNEKDKDGKTTSQLIKDTFKEIKPFYDMI